MTIEQHISEYPVPVTSIVLDYGSGAQSEIIDVPSERYEEFKEADLNDVKQSVHQLIFNIRA